MNTKYQTENKDIENKLKTLKKKSPPHWNVGVALYVHPSPKVTWLLTTNSPKGQKTFTNLIGSIFILRILPIF